MDSVGVIAVVAIAWEGLEYLWEEVLGEGLEVAGYGNEEEGFTPKQHFLVDAIVDFFGALVAAIVVFELIEWLV